MNQIPKAPQYAMVAQQANTRRQDLSCVRYALIQMQQLPKMTPKNQTVYASQVIIKTTTGKTACNAQQELTKKRTQILGVSTVIQDSYQSPVRSRALHVRGVNLVVRVPSPVKIAPHRRGNIALLSIMTVKA